MSEDVTCDFQPDTFLVLDVEDHSIWQTSKESGDLRLKENCVEFNSVEFCDLFVKRSRCKEKIEVHQDLTYCPLSVRCITNCGMKELLLVALIVSLSGVATMAVGMSLRIPWCTAILGFVSTGHLAWIYPRLSCQAVSLEKIRLPALVVLPDEPKFKKFGAWELIPGILICLARICPESFCCCFLVKNRDVKLS